MLTFDLGETDFLTDLVNKRTNMETTYRTVLVTGGAGYIGSHTCKALSQAGFTPISYDSLFRGNDWATKYGPLEIGDLHDSERLREVIARYKPVGVVHFAALAYVGESVENPLMYYKNNVSGTISLLNAMRAENIGRIVFSSTCATYGTPDKNPIHEDMPQSPINPYGQSKLMVEQILKDCTQAWRLSAVALRYFNAAGADAELEIGECHDPETHLIPLTLSAAKGDSKSLTIFGKDHPTPDGTCIRDYIHVTDLANAHVKALEFSAKSPGFEAFNLGTGKGVSILELINLAQAVTGKVVPFRYGDQRPGDPSALISDPQRANKVLGWTPKHSDLSNILETAWAWMNKS